MKAKLPLIARILLGLVFVLSGIAGLLMPPPPDLPEPLSTFTAGLAAAIYFMPFLKITEIVCGLMLLAGFRVALALVVLAPIVIHIFMVHAFIAPEGLPVAIFLGALTAYLTFWSAYGAPVRQLFRA